jgi:ProP effector
MTSKELDVIVAMLAMRFPRTFFVFERRRLPLKLKIRDDLATALGEQVDINLLAPALRRYCNNPGYLHNSKAGAVRINLDGEAAGTFTDDEAAWAKVRLDHFRAKAKVAKIIPQEPPQAPAKPAESARPTPRPMPRGAARDGLAALREAAQRRRATG